MARRGSRYDARRLAAPALLAAVACGLVAGCGTGSDPSPPTGVDQLVIPTPSVDPGDFVDDVDNPWLPLPGGATWTYRVTRPPADDPSDTLTVTVQEEQETVAGVPATVVERRGPDGETTDFYAQDRDGNVWWLGREGSWLAGEDGARAGLAMPADPRVGDGWREALLEGVVEDRATVISLDADVRTPAGEYDGLLELETTSALATAPGARELYARGVGLVHSVTTRGTTYVAELVSGP